MLPPYALSVFLRSPPAPPLSLDESILIGRDGDGGLSRYVRGKAVLKGDACSFVRDQT